MELVTPECYYGLSEEEKQAQLYLAFYTWADDTDLLDPECFLGYPHRDEAIYAALHIQGGTVDPSCIESLPPEERQLAMYEAVYAAAADGTLTHHDCFLSLSPEVRDLAFYTALYVIAGDVELLSPECFLGSSREEQRAALYAAAYSIAQEPPTPPDPILELAPDVWLKADSLSLEDGDPVDLWTDSSGNGRDATQANFPRMPQFHEGAVNGLPAIYFDGVDDAVMGAANVARPSTLFFVCQSNMFGDGTILNTVNGNEGINTMCASGQIQVGRGGVGAIMQSSATVFSFSVVEVVASAAGMQLMMNGAQEGLSGDAGAFTSGSYRIGSYRSSDNALSFNGYVAEVIPWSRELSTEDRAIVRQYLASKYAIPIP